VGGSEAMVNALVRSVLGQKHRHMRALFHIWQTELQVTDTYRYPQQGMRYGPPTCMVATTAGAVGFKQLKPNGLHDSCDCCAFCYTTAGV
jgi:hypothetical protein